MPKEDETRQEILELFSNGKITVSDAADLLSSANREAKSEIKLKEEFQKNEQDKTNSVEKR